MSDHCRHRLLPGVLAALLLAVFTMAGGCGEEAVIDPTRPLPVAIDGRTFQLELALDPRTRYQGLSDRESIAPDGGMLFVFPTPRVTHFVMRRCLVPIDVIFVGPAGHVVAMHQMTVEPYDTPEDELTRYPSRYKVRYAIELADGTLDDLDLEPGDKIDLPAAEALKALAR